MKTRTNKAMVKDETKSFACTYHGWVMIPLDLGDGKMLPYNDQAKMIKIGKKVASSQMVARKQGDKALVSVHPSGVTVTASHPGDENQASAAPLLSAAMETISCMLLSKDTGIAVVMAFTWDHTGARGVGCDVIKFGGKNPKKGIKNFGLCFSKAMEEQAKVAAGKQQENPLKIAPVEKPPLMPVSSKSLNTNNIPEDSASMETSRRFSEIGYGFSSDMPGKRRRSSAVNETDKGEYLAVDSVGGTNAGYLAAMNEPLNEEEDDSYIMVRGRRSTNWDISEAPDVTAPAIATVVS